MEVPPGRLLLQSSGGRDALTSFLAEALHRRLNGILRTERVRDGSTARGVLVFKEGNGTLASHSWRDNVDGPRAIPAIVQDAVKGDAVLELRSYDHKASSVRPDLLETAHSSARIEGLPDVARVLAEIEAQDHTARERMRVAIDALNPQDAAIEDLRAELHAVKDGSAILMQQLREQREREDPAAVVERNRAQLELEQARTEVGSRAEKLRIKEDRLQEDAHALTEGEASVVARVKELEAAQAALSEDRRQLAELYENLQSEMDRLDAARREFDATAEAAGHRDQEIVERERSMAAWEPNLRDREGRVTAREQGLLRKEESLKARSSAVLEATRASARAEKEVQKREREVARRQAELVAAEEDAARDGKALEVFRSKVGHERTVLEKHGERLRQDSASAEQERTEARRSHAQIATRLEVLKGLEKTLADGRNRLRGQAARLLRAEKAVVSRTRDVEALQAELKVRERNLAEAVKGFEIRAAELDERAAQLGAREETIEKSEAAVEAKAEGTSGRIEELESELREREETIASKEAQLREAEAALETKSNRVEEFAQELAAAQAEAQKRVAKANEAREQFEKDRRKFTREKAASERARNRTEKSLAVREGKVRTAEDDIEERRVEFDRTALELRRRSDQLDERAKKLSALETNFASEKKTLEERIAQRFEQLEERDRELKDRVDALDVEKTELLQARGQLKAKLAVLGDRERRLRALEADLDVRRAGLDRIREGLKKL
ncbi:MAG TPA: hypothetical protein VIL58_09235 [Thermoplasmata archaeon]